MATTSRARCWHSLSLYSTSLLLHVQCSVISLPLRTTPLMFCFPDFCARLSTCADQHGCVPKKHVRVNQCKLISSDWTVTWTNWLRAARKQRACQWTRAVVTTQSKANCCVSLKPDMVTQCTCLHDLNENIKQHTFWNCNVGLFWELKGSRNLNFKSKNLCSLN